MSRSPNAKRRITKGTKRRFAPDPAAMAAIGAAVVKAVAVDVVAESAWRDVNDLPVHPDFRSSAGDGVARPAGGVFGGGALREVPVVLHKTFKVGGVDDSETAFR